MRRYETPEMGNVIKYQTHVVLCLDLRHWFKIFPLILHLAK